MTSPSFLLTGALGCLGAWVVRNLIRAGASATILDLGADLARLRLVMGDDELAAVRLIRGDIGELATVEQALATAQATHIIHLAALQVPFCKADPSLGARVNVLGTVNIFEAARRAGIKHIVYASSVAVYGHSEEYGEELLADDAPQHPRTHYGVYKQANEGTARVYWLDNGISSIGLRPYTIYGPGRDQGLTSGATRAMVAAALGRGYQLPFSGRQGLQYADDAARLFIRAAEAPVSGAQVFNLRGSIASSEELVAAIEAAAPDVAGKITVTGSSLPFPSDLSDHGLRAALGPLTETSLAEGVAASIAHFRAALAGGRLDVARYL